MHMKIHVYTKTPMPMNVMRLKMNTSTGILMLMRMDMRTATGMLME